MTIWSRTGPTTVHLSLDPSLYHLPGAMGASGNFVVITTGHAVAEAVPRVVADQDTLLTKLRRTIILQDQTSPAMNGHSLTPDSMMHNDDRNIANLQVRGLPIPFSPRHIMIRNPSI